MPRWRDGPVHRCKVWLKYLAGVEASSGVQIFHVTDLSRGQSEALDAAGIKRRLVSYFLLKNRPDNALAKYMAGMWSPRALTVSDFREPIPDAYGNFRNSGAVGGEELIRKK